MCKATNAISKYALEVLIACLRTLCTTKALQTTHMWHRMQSIAKSSKLINAQHVDKCIPYKSHVAFVRGIF